MKWIALVAVLALAGCGDDDPEPPRATLAHGHGLSAELPAGWQEARESLTPNLGDPREVLSVGTFPLLYHDDECAHVPTSALKDIGPRDAFVSLQERGRGASLEGFPPRPGHFGPGFADGPSEGLECAGREELREYWFTFSDNGRMFHTRVTLGPDATPDREREAWGVLDSLVIDAGERPDWRSAG